MFKNIKDINLDSLSDDHYEIIVEVSNDWEEDTFVETRFCSSIDSLHKEILGLSCYETILELKKVSKLN